MPAVRATPTGIELDVWVTPRAARPGLFPLHGDRVRVAVSAPPVDGEANEAVRALVAKQLGVARGAVAVLRGATGRTKTLAVTGEPAALLARGQALCISAADAPDNDLDAAAAASAPNTQRKGSKQ